MKKLEQILTIQSESYGQWRMFAYLIRQIKAMDVDFYVHSGNIYITKGVSTVYPCIVAHMDTVHDIVEDLSILRVGDNLTGFNRVTMKQSGIGGDDKVGIYIALECLIKFNNIKVVFFRDEEVGCVGSYKADMPFFDDCSFVLQCDRRGNTDVIHNASGTQLCSKDFKNSIKGIMKRYSYSFNTGMMTDVMALKENGLKVSCINIACGYYNPHMANEYVNIGDVKTCMSFVFDVILAYGKKVFKHISTYKKYGNYYSGYGSYDKYDDSIYDKWEWNPKSMSYEKRISDDEVWSTPVYKKDEKPLYKKDESEMDKVWNGFKPFNDVEDDESESCACDWCQKSVPTRYHSASNAWLCEECELIFK